MRAGVGAPPGDEGRLVVTDEEVERLRDCVDTDPAAARAQVDALLGGRIGPARPDPATPDHRPHRPPGSSAPVHPGADPAQDPASVAHGGAVHDDAAVQDMDAVLQGLPPQERRQVARLILVRGRARHFLRDMGAHDDTTSAIRALDAQQDPLLMAEALNMHAISSGYLGDLHGQLRCLDRGLEILAGHDGPAAVRLRLAMRHNLAVSLYDLGDARGALGLLETARQESGTVGTPRYLEWVLMSSVAAASFLLRGYEGQEPVQGEERHRLLLDVRLWTAEAVAAADAAVAAGDGAANRRGASWCQARRAQLEGDLEQALVHARAAVTLVDTLGEMDVLARSRALLAEILLDLGRLDEAEDLLRSATGATDRLGSVTSVMVWHMLATCRERRGDLVGALAAMRSYVTAVTASRDVQARSTAAVNVARLRREEVERDRDRWRRTSEDERRAARVDALTGIENRRAFSDAMAERAVRGGRVALAIIDLDHFKTVNDRFGHVAGDEVLVRVSRAMLAALPTGRPAYLYRVGGEEFVLVLDLDDGAAADLDDGGVARLVERVRTAASMVDFGDMALPSGEALAVTASAGVTTGSPVAAASPAGDLLRAADRHLYSAKNLGRDRLIGP